MKKKFFIPIFTIIVSLFLQADACNTSMAKKGTPAHQTEPNQKKDKEDSGVKDDKNDEDHTNKENKNWLGKEIVFIPMNMEFFNKALYGHQNTPFGRLSAYNKEVVQAFKKFIFEGIDLKELMINFSLYVEGSLSDDEQKSNVKEITQKLAKMPAEKVQQLFKDLDTYDFIAKNLSRDLSAIQNYNALLFSLAFLSLQENEKIANEYIALDNDEQIGENAKALKLETLMLPFTKEVQTKAKVTGIGNKDNLNLFTNLYKHIIDKLRNQTAI